VERSWRDPRERIGGHSLYLECAGSGSPTVVLEAGFGGASQDWANVAPALGLTTRTCAYDRAGLGASDPIPGVHDPRDEVRDLQRLVELGEGDPEGSPGERRVVVRGPGGAGNCQDASFRNNAV